MSSWVRFALRVCLGLKCSISSGMLFRMDLHVISASLGNEMIINLFLRTLGNLPDYSLAQTVKMSSSSIVMLGM